MSETLGRKFDSGKMRMGLLPPLAIESVARVLTFGAQKYAKDNWKKVDNAHDRYTDAALRHVFAYMKGESTDAETGESHLAHALCCLMFMLDLDLQKQKEPIVSSINSTEDQQPYTVFRKIEKDLNSYADKKVSASDKPEIKAFMNIRDALTQVSQYKPDLSIGDYQTNNASVICHISEDGTYSFNQDLTPEYLKRNP